MFAGVIMKKIYLLLSQMDIKYFFVRLYSQTVTWFTPWWFQLTEKGYRNETKLNF